MPWTACGIARGTVPSRDRRPPPFLMGRWMPVDLAVLALALLDEPRRTAVLA